MILIYLILHYTIKRVGGLELTVDLTLAAFSSMLWTCRMMLTADDRSRCSMAVIILALQSFKLIISSVHARACCDRICIVSKRLTYYEHAISAIAKVRIIKHIG